MTNYTTGHCANHSKPGGCQLHNLQCGWPNCDRRPTDAVIASGGDSASLEQRARELLAAQVDDEAIKILMMQSPHEGSMVNLGTAIRAITAALAYQQGMEYDLIAKGVAESIENGDGVWVSCTGCLETEDGHHVGRYPYSKAFRCHLGGGCSECGGIGAVWDTTDYAEFGDEMAALTNQQGVGGWQPIEAAPQGTMILLADMTAKEARHWSFVGWKHHWNKAGHVETPSALNRRATHWKHLPEPPTQPAGDVGRGAPAETPLR